MGPAQTLYGIRRRANATTRQTPSVDEAETTADLLLAQISFRYNIVRQELSKAGPDPQEPRTCRNGPDWRENQHVGATL
jgi:hypothetical protein